MGGGDDNRGNVLVPEGRLTVDGSVIGKQVFVIGGGAITVNGSVTSPEVRGLDGRITVNGVLTSGNVEIRPLASLGGNGRIIGNVDNKGGEIEPGNSIGTLHIFGPLDMEPHSEYQVQINGASSDEIEVSEKAAIESSTFEIERYNTAASPVVPGKTYKILTAGGGLEVTAPTLAIADFPFINFTLSEDGFNGYLTTSRSAERFAELASTPNEAAVANALDSATSSPAWAQVVGASTAEARAAFSSLSNASIHASAAGVLSEQSHFLRDAVLDRLRQDFPSSGAPAPADGVLSYAGDTPAPAVAALPTKKAPAIALAPLGPVYAVWAQGLGSWGSLSGNSNVARTDELDRRRDLRRRRHLQSHVALRLRRRLHPLQLQFRRTFPASGSSDSYHAALYGGWQGGAWALRGGGAFSWNDIDTSRQVTAVALGRRAERRLCRQDVASLRRGGAQFRLRRGRVGAVRQYRLCACRGRLQRVRPGGDERIGDLRHDLHDARRARLLRPALEPDGAGDARVASCVWRCHPGDDAGLPARRGRLRPGRLADRPRRARHRTWR